MRKAILLFKQGKQETITICSLYFRPISPSWDFSGCEIHCSPASLYSYYHKCSIKFFIFLLCLRPKLKGCCNHTATNEGWSQAQVYRADTKILSELQLDTSLWMSETLESGGEGVARDFSLQHEKKKGKYLSGTESSHLWEELGASGHRWAELSLDTQAMEGLN